MSGHWAETSMLGQEEGPELQLLPRKISDEAGGSFHNPLEGAAFPQQALGHSQPGAHIAPRMSLWLLGSGAGVGSQSWGGL